VDLPSHPVFGEGSLLGYNTLFPGRVIRKFAKKFKTPRRRIKADLFDKLVESLQGAIPELAEPVEMNVIIAEHVLCKFWRHQRDNENGGQKRAADDAAEAESPAKRMRTGRL